MGRLSSDLVTALLRSTRSLQILFAVQHHSVQHLEDTSILSWVPLLVENPCSFMLWAAAIRCRTYCAGAETEPKHDIVRRGTALKYCGMFFDQGSSCSSIVPREAYPSQESSHTNPVDTTEPFFENNEHASRGAYSTEEQCLQAQVLYMMLTAGMFMGGREEFAVCQKWKAGIAADQKSGRDPP